MTEAEPTGETPLQVSLNRLPGVRRRGVLLIPALAMVVALVFPFPAHGRAWGALFDLAHAPSFFLVFVCMAALRDRRSGGEKAVSLLPWQIKLQRLFLLAAVLCGIGIVCELAQQLVGVTMQERGVSRDVKGNRRTGATPARPGRGSSYSSSSRTERGSGGLLPSPIQALKASVKKAAGKTSASAGRKQGKKPRR